jgi:predicted XRE-type DNA-binding protein
MSLHTPQRGEIEHAQIRRAAEVRARLRGRPSPAPQTPARPAIPKIVIEPREPRVMPLEHIQNDPTIPKYARRGERNNRAKLKDAQVEELRALVTEGGLLQYEAAARFGISRGQVSKIINQKSRR